MTGYYIRTGFENMDVEAVHHFLSRGSYWAEDIPLETVATSLRHSFCAGVGKIKRI